MTPTVLAFTLAVLAADPPPPERNPIAPSLPVLTREQEARIEQVIDRFILADIGVLKGGEAQAATASFEALGMESVPHLIRGLNKAAMMQQSCPVLTISRKLQRLLAATEDKELLDFAVDNIGAGVGATRYGGALRDLKTQAMLRKNYLARLPPKTPDRMNTHELALAASTEKLPKLQAILTELETRRGPEAAAALVRAASVSDPDTARAGLLSLERNLTQQTVAVVKDQFKADNTEVRLAAVRAGAARKPAMGGELVQALTDPQAEVRQAAHQALVQLGGDDLGPTDDTSLSERLEAQQRWRAWWERQGAK